MEPESEYGGIVTRGLAFAIDVALINLLFAVFGALVSLILSAFDSLPSSIDLSTVVVSATAWVIWASLYLASFWMLTGQTPGMRALGVAVERPDGTTIGRGRSVRRLIGMVLAAIPFMAGYALILFDGERRGFHDRFAGTVVRYRAPDPSRARRFGIRARDASS